LHFLCKLKIWTEFANGRCAQILNYGTWDLDGNGGYMDRRSSTNYLGTNRATKMVDPLGSAQITILALNRKMQFPLSNYGQYFCESSIWSQRISPQVFMNFRDVQIFF
jgi:hypothetical protein